MTIPLMNTESEDYLFVPLINMDEKSDHPNNPQVWQGFRTLIPKQIDPIQFTSCYLKCFLHKLLRNKETHDKNKVKCQIKEMMTNKWLDIFSTY